MVMIANIMISFAGKAWLKTRLAYKISLLLLIAVFKPYSLVKRDIAYSTLTYNNCQLR